jgi:hypothetical protein
MSARDVEDEEIADLATKMEAFAGTLSPRQRQTFIALVNRAMEAEDVEGYAFDTYLQIDSVDGEDTGQPHHDFKLMPLYGGLLRFTRPF